MPVMCAVGYRRLRLSRSSAYGFRQMSAISERLTGTAGTGRSHGKDEGTAEGMTLWEDLL
jgi:hypothetical protein